MRPFLYLDNYHVSQAPTRFDALLGSSGMKIKVRRTNEGDFPDGTDYCGVFLSPSFDSVYDDIPWVRQEVEVVRKLAASDLPMLGLCFGSQMLACALVGSDQVFARTSRETGYGSIHLTANAKGDVLAGNLTSPIRVFHWHGDEVRADHPDVVVLANNHCCANQFWRWSLGPVWGLQPHPEFDRSGLLEWVKRNPGQFRSASLDLDPIGIGPDVCAEAFGVLRTFVRFVVDRERPANRAPVLNE